MAVCCMLAVEGGVTVRACLIILNFPPFILFFYSQKGGNYSPKTSDYSPKTAKYSLKTADYFSKKAIIADVSIVL